MIAFSRRELFELASIYIVVNTPRSLFDSLVRCDSVTKLRYHADLDQLIDYFDRLTSRGRRTEIAVALAYAILLGILLHKDNLGAQVAPDVSRLQWGEQLRLIATSVNPATGILDMSATPKAKVEYSSASPSRLVLPPGTSAHTWENVK